MSSSRVGSYVPRGFHSQQNIVSPRNVTSPVPGASPTLPISPALGIRMGAHEEDLSSMSSIQSLILRQQPPDKLSDQDLQQEQELQELLLQHEQHELLQNSEEQSHEQHEDHESEQPIPSLEQFSSLSNPLSNLYLPSLPQEFLKTPRAGPPNSTSTLDILV